MVADLQSGDGALQGGRGGREMCVLERRRQINVSSTSLGLLTFALLFGRLAVIHLIAGSLALW